MAFIRLSWGICSLVLLVLMVHSQETDKNQQNLAVLLPADCAEIAATGVGGIRPPNGKYYVYVGEGRGRVLAYCDMETDRGGWTIIQRRSSADVNFYRSWSEYEFGFGDPEKDHWLGNTYLHSMTVNKRYVLRIELTDWENKTYYAEYNKFVVSGAGCEYKLESLGDFCGDCGDSLTYQLGSKFSTFDNDNDAYFGDCSRQFHGAWWYRDCHESNLNGDYKIGGYHSSYADGINWKSGKDYYYSYEKSEMKIRPYKY